MICSTSHVQLASSRKRNLPTPPPSFTDVNDSSSSSSCSSSSSSSFASPPNDESQSPVLSCDLLNVLTDARFRPVFQAIEEIKRRKCRPDLERILKYVEKRSLHTHQFIYQREQIIQMLDELLKYGLISKVFHKGGFTIRIKHEKYAKILENLSQSSKDSPAPPPIRESPSPEFAGKTPSVRSFVHRCFPLRSSRIISNLSFDKRK